MTAVDFMLLHTEQ